MGRGGCCAGGTEPVAQEMLREALQLRKSSPRSALVIGIAAVEVAFKQCVAELVPAAEWLAFNVPSPPVEQMLRHYLPQLPAKLGLDEGAHIPRDTLKLIVRGVTLRNQLVDKRSAPPEQRELADILTAVGSVLRLLDYYCGREWALSHVMSVLVHPTPSRRPRR